MLDNVQQAPLSKSQLATVLEIYEEIGVLSVRDKDTFVDSKAEPYGTEWTPVTPNDFGRPSVDNTTRKKRVIEMHFRDSDRFPEGIPLGVTYIYRVTQAEGMGPDRAFRFVGAKYDAIQDHRKRLRALAYDRKWMTQEERLLDEKAKNRRRQRAQSQEMTLSESIGKSIADGLKTAVADAVSLIEKAPRHARKKSKATDESED